MKYTYIKISALLIIVISLTSCAIDDIKPQNALVEDTVIRDETSALAVINRMYTMYRDGQSGGFPSNSPRFTSGLSAAGQETQFTGPSPFGDNNVIPTNGTIQSVYQREYAIINLANFFIELVEKGDANVDEVRKNEMLAEARFFRGYAHFNLLRVFGQFYDRNSEYGIVVSTTPYRGAEERPRNTVEETYNLVVSDLQFATDNGVNGRQHFYISATTAKAALAKVQLYMGEFALASTNALSVINNTDGYALALDYNSIFNTKFGTETLLAPFTGDNTEGDISPQGVSRYFTTSSLPSNYFKTLADDQDGVSGDGSIDNTTGYDPRYSFVFSSPDRNPKYPFDGTTFGQGNTVNILRMAEMYLIYAEAETRRDGGSLDDALEKLNDIRTRAGVTIKVLSDKATLLGDIRNEKMLELFEETGESWFDLVRYDRLGDVDATVLKPTITSANELIMPLPQQALDGNSLLVPNP